MYLYFCVVSERNKKIIYTKLRFRRGDVKPEKIKMNHKYKCRLLGLFLLRSQGDFFDCKISSLLSRLESPL